MKRQTTGLEKIFINHVPHKELVSRVYKELFKLNNKKKTNPIKIKKTKILNTHFTSPKKIYELQINT